MQTFKASPLIKHFLTPGGWLELKCVYWKVSVGLKCVHTPRMDSFLNLSPLYTHTSRKVISVSEISAVNFMVVFNQLLGTFRLDYEYDIEYECEFQISNQ